MSFESRLLAARENADSAFLRALGRLHWNDEIASAARHVLVGGGKALRPALLAWSAETVGGAPPSEGVLDLALALEMIHTYSLVHDDLPCMDDDDFRRGRPTLHRLHGEAIAVLAGDALLTGAFEVAGTAAIDDSLKTLAMLELARASGGAGMIAGQVLDLRATGRKDGVPLEEIHRLKTGALFGASLAIGCAAGQARGSVREGSTVEKARDWGFKLGLLFQIVDDLLDTKAGTGKSVGKDARQQKRTYVTELGEAEARRRAESVARDLVTEAPCWGAKSVEVSSLVDFVLGRDR
jgi:geranylgeranyl diphosphate synthase type II